MREATEFFGDVRLGELFRDVAAAVVTSVVFRRCAGRSDELLFTLSSVVLVAMSAAVDCFFRDFFAAELAFAVGGAVRAVADSVRSEAAAVADVTDVAEVDADVDADDGRLALAAGFRLVFRFFFAPGASFDFAAVVFCFFFREDVT